MAGVKRKNIHVATLKKVEDFLSKQKKPVFKSGIVRAINVDFNSVGIALENLKIKIDEEGRVSVTKRSKK